MSTILYETKLESNSKIKINFNGGDLSSDSGLFLINEFAAKFGFQKLVEKIFKTNDTSRERLHKDDKNLLQMVLQTIAGYFTADNADELKDDPVMTAALEKDSLASQPTLSRFVNRLDGTTLAQMNEIQKQMRRIAYSVEMPEFVLLDIDTTLLDAYGKQEGADFNYHYQSNGYHPILCYDGITRDLLKAELRNGTDYCCKGAADFLQPLLDEYANEYPGIMLFLRGDSGFATPELFDQAETNGVSYAIRLKSNKRLMGLAGHLDDELSHITRSNAVDHAVVYGEFPYQAGSWKYPRRVVCKVEKPYGQLAHIYTFLVTNMDLGPDKVVQYYCGRGNMENFIKEGKNGFAFTTVSNASMMVNANLFQIRILAYTLFNYFRRMVLPKSMEKQQIDTIRIKLLKVASRVVHGARYVTYKICSCFPYKKEFMETLANISGLSY